MVLALADKWIWDFWIAEDSGLYHAYFLQADKSLGEPSKRHWYVTQGHATSSDLSNWTYHGTGFAPAPAPAWDDFTTWTGSVLRDETGVWHLFYTGTSRADQGLKQRIGHATSLDMFTWSRVGDGLALDISRSDYEEYTPGHWHDRAFRDPWVMRHPEGEGWIMYFVARRPGLAEPNAGGTIGFATSPDLKTWTLGAPIFADGLFGQMEVPQVFCLNDRWYMLFCTDGKFWSEKYKKINPQRPTRGTHYLMADTPLGPWRIAPGPFLDGYDGWRYSGKIVKTDDDLRFLGFLQTPPQHPEFVGEICDPIPVSVNDDGLLRLCL